jgi:hypothetical protein
MIQPVGYFIRGQHEPFVHGELYNYYWGENGLFINAEGPLLRACIPIAETVTRGLLPIQRRIALDHGKIPVSYFDDILRDMMLTPEMEKYYGIVWDDGYKISKPIQLSSESTVTYGTLDNVVVEIHSHGDNLPLFSTQDNKDELGLKIYGVVGLLKDLKEVSGSVMQYRAVLLRVGVYGYFDYVDFRDIFEGESNYANWKFVETE